MNNQNNRVLGRVLAVEEIVAVSGARLTSILPDYGSLPKKDGSDPQQDDGYAYGFMSAHAPGAGMKSHHAKAL